MIDDPIYAREKSSIAILSDPCRSLPIYNALFPFCRLFVLGVKIGYSGQIKRSM